MDTAALQKLKLRPSGAVLELEPLSDTGNAVPIGIRLVAPSGLSIVSFEVFAPDNPVPQVLKVMLACGVPSITLSTCAPGA